jgi:hypothetical protein
MIRNVLISRDQKRHRSIEIGAMDDPGEPVRQGFEMVEGIEMVPGTVHLVDSELIIPRKSVEKLSGRIHLERSFLCSRLTLPSARDLQPQASNWQQRRRRFNPSTHKRPR